MPLAKDTDGTLSAFRGLKKGADISEPAKSMASIVDGIFLDFRIGHISPLKIIHEAWNDIVPKRFVGMSEPSDMGATVLYVRTANSAIKQELMFEERKILTKLTKLAGCSKLRKIKFL